ncbi:hypothetical protein BofuT4_uP085970.1 [Botrytis cinerea T4]|uniref:Uncharacterized protein n=1 Tax=Botryotinia fuckeliana (strain T4) TaxID=999810 RepID=G2YH98_BOTF4|nr:hypothetical protein BofuT4_uP085970.1 [Botrytis cinerea T4]
MCTPEEEGLTKDDAYQIPATSVKEQNNAFSPVSIKNKDVTSTAPYGKRDEG